MRGIRNTLTPFFLCLTLFPAKDIWGAETLTDISEPPETSAQPSFVPEAHPTPAPPQAHVAEASERIRLALDSGALAESVSSAWKTSLEFQKTVESWAGFTTALSYESKGIIVPTTISTTGMDEPVESQSKARLGTFHLDLGLLFACPLPSTVISANPYVVWQRRTVDFPSGTSLSKAGGTQSHLGSGFALEFQFAPDPDFSTSARAGIEGNRRFLIAWLGADVSWSLPQEFQQNLSQWSHLPLVDLRASARLRLARETSRLVSESSAGTYETQLRSNGPEIGLALDWLL